MLVRAGALSLRGIYLASSNSNLEDLFIDTRF
jgi:hypothetical protein